jgi:hypothetical protein
VGALTAKELLSLIALAGTVIAAIANILVLPGAPARRLLLALFFIASLMLAVYTFSQHQGRQGLELQIARRELDERTRSLRQAEEMARRRIEQERESYEKAVDEALVRMRSEFKKQLEEQARTIVDESSKTGQGFEELRRLVELRKSMQREDVQRFLVGSWEPVTRPPPLGLFRVKQITRCDAVFADDASVKMEYYTPATFVYDIDDIQGSRIFLRVTRQAVGYDFSQTNFVIDLDRRADRFSIAERGSAQPAVLCKRRP